MPNMEVHTIEDVCLNITDFNMPNLPKEIVFNIKGEEYVPWTVNVLKEYSFNADLFQQTTKLTNLPFELF